MPVRNLNRMDGVCVRSGTGGDVRQNDFVVKASNTVKMYDIVKFDTGEIVNALALDANANTLTASGGAVTTLGVALGNGSGGDTVPVAIWDDNTEMKMRLYNATASSAEQQDVTVGTAYNFGRFTTVAGGDAHYVVTTGTTNPEFVIQEKSKDSAADDDYGWVWVKKAVAYRANK